MKALLILILALGLIPVSIMTMMWGWGLEPANWGWIAFGYLWMVITPAITEALK